MAASTDPKSGALQGQASPFLQAQQMVESSFRLARMQIEADEHDIALHNAKQDQLSQDPRNGFIAHFEAVATKKRQARGNVHRRPWFILDPPFPWRLVLPRFPPPIGKSYRDT